VKVFKLGVFAYSPKKETYAKLIKKYTFDTFLQTYQGLTL